MFVCVSACTCTHVRALVHAHLYASERVGLHLYACLCVFSPPHLCGPVFTIIFQYCLFSVMFAFSSYLFISSRLLSIHLRLGRPLLHFRGTTMSIIFLERLSSLLLICPYQFNCLCVRACILYSIAFYAGCNTRGMSMWIHYEFAFTSVVRPCPSFFLRGCFLLFSWYVHTNLIASI